MFDKIIYHVLCKILEIKNGCQTRYIKTSSADHTTLKLGCSNPMSLDVDDIIDPPCDLIVSILVPKCPVPTEVKAGVRTVVGVQELLVVSVDGPSHSWPRLSDTEITTNVCTDQLLSLDQI